MTRASFLSFVWRATGDRCRCFDGKLSYSRTCRIFNRGVFYWQAWMGNWWRTMDVQEEGGVGNARPGGGWLVSRFMNVERSMENKNLEFFLLVGAWVVVLGMTWSSSFICSVIDSRVFLESNFKVSSLHGRVRSYFTRASIYVYKLCIYARNHLFSKNIAILSHEQKHLRETHFPIFLKIKISSNRYYITVSFTSRDITLQHFFFDQNSNLGRPAPWEPATTEKKKKRIGHVPPSATTWPKESSWKPGLSPKRDHRFIVITPPPHSKHLSPFFRNRNWPESRCIYHEEESRRDTSKYLHVVRDEHGVGTVGVRGCHTPYPSLFLSLSPFLPRWCYCVAQAEFLQPAAGASLLHARSTIEETFRRALWSNDIIKAEVRGKRRTEPPDASSATSSRESRAAG